MAFTGQSWSVDFDGPTGTITLRGGAGASISGARPALVTRDGTLVVPDAAWTCTASADGLRCESPTGWVLAVKASSGPGAAWVALQLSVTNNTGADVALDRACVLHGAEVAGNPGWDRVFRHGVDLCDYTRMMEINDPVFGGDYHSHAVGGFARADGDGALVLGFTDHRHAFNSVDWKVTGGAAGELAAYAERDGVTLADGAVLTISPLLVGAGPGFGALMDDYAKAVAAIMQPRTATPSNTGWCSWYHYYGTESNDGIMENVEWLAESRFAKALRVIQIDDGWQLPNQEAPRNWGDWHAGGKFPDGMKAAADRIHEAGFEAGLWLAPFSVEKASKFYEENEDLLVQGADTDGPLNFWGVHGLDLTHPRVLEFLRETFTRVFDEWGYDYIKIDFLMHALQPGVRYDNEQTRAEYFRAAMGVIRECAGDRFILGCGSPMAPAIGLVDGMRIGTDLSSRWYLPIGSWPVGNCNIKSCAIQTTWRQWMHGRWWQNDPDCLVVRDFGTEPEIAMFQRMFPNEAGTAADYGLSKEEASFWARMIWLSGGMTLFSERMSTVPQDRMAIFESMFPQNHDPGHVVDHFADPDVLVWRSDAAKPVVGVFNISDDEKKVRVAASKLGLAGPWSFRERLSGETFSGQGDTIEFPELPPHAGRLWIAQ